MPVQKYQSPPRPPRPANAALWNEFKQAFKGKWSWGSGLVLPLAGSVAVLGFAAGDMGWLAAILTGLLGLAYAAFSGGRVALKSWLDWRRLARAYDSPSQVQIRVAEHKAFLDRQICSYQATLDLGKELDQRIEAERASIAEFISVPQYGDMRSHATQLAMLQDAHQLLIYPDRVQFASDAERLSYDPGPVEGEPPLEAFRVRGDGDPRATSPKEWFDRQRVFKRAIYRRDVNTLNDVRDKALTARAAIAQDLKEACDERSSL